MEISAKLKARHVQIHIFHTKQTESPGVTNIETDYHRYSQIGSECMVRKIKRPRNVIGLDCTQFSLSKVRT